ncbi:MAG: hypothetical protein QXQ43_06925 [Nitrososphaerota archaeon]
MSRVEGLKEYCERCLRTDRWGGRVVLMIVDAAFTSIGLNYFLAVVPKVELFNKRFVESGLINDLRKLAAADINVLEDIWRNQRSWYIAKKIANYLSTLDVDDRNAYRSWAGSSTLKDWRKNPIGCIKGVGLVTYQYLRMMGGVDTVMPDKIVKRVINKIRVEAGLKPIVEDIKFIEETEKLAYQTGYRPIELCWMTWLIQSEGEMIRISKYAKLLPKI